MAARRTTQTVLAVADYVPLPLLLVHSVGLEQCDQIGRILKVLGDKISNKKVHMIGNFLGNF